MENLIDWLQRYITEGENNPNLLRKENVLILIDEVMEYVEGADEINGKSLFVLIEKYIMKIRSAAGLQGTDYNRTLEPVTSKLLDLVILLAIVDEDSLNILIDETTLLSTISGLLVNPFIRPDYTKLLTALEVLTRGLSLKWTSPALSQTTSVILATLLQENPEQENFLIGLRVINNIIFHNRNNVCMVTRDPNYGNVMRKLLQLLENLDLNREVISLTLNFAFLSNHTITVRLPSQQENIQKAFQELQMKGETAKTAEDQRSIARSMDYLSLCLSTLLDRLNKEDEVNGRISEAPVNAAQGTSKASGPSQIRGLTEEMMSIVFNRMFPKLLTLMRATKGHVVLKSMLNFMKALCPEYIAPVVYNDMWDNFIKTLNEISALTSSTPKAKVTVLGTQLFFVCRVAKASPRNFRVDSFTYALNNCTLVIPKCKSDLISNTMTVRLMREIGSLNAKQNPPCPGVASKIAGVLKEATLAEVLTNLLNQPVPEGVCPPMELSTCVVEIFSILSKISKSHQNILERFQDKNILPHISNCIFFGNEELIQQSFVLMRSVGFSDQCDRGLAHSIKMMREVYISSEPKNDTPCLKSTPVLSAQALRGITVLNQNLELLEKQEQIAEGEHSIGDILSWYKLRSDLHEMEMNTTTTQIFSLNQHIASLKLILEKQSELLSTRAETYAEAQREINLLRKQLASNKDAKNALQLKHIKSVDTLNKQLDDYVKQLENKFEKLTKVEGELAVLQENYAKLEASMLEATENVANITKERNKYKALSDKLESDYDKSKRKVSNLEADLKKSEETRKTTEALLEAERRKVEIIQQVLGNRSTL